jgi:hypothetical protein
MIEKARMMRQRSAELSSAVLRSALMRPDLLRRDQDAAITAGIVAAAVATPLLLTVSVPALVQLPVVLLMLCVVPGLALLRLAAGTISVTIVVLAVAMSLALDVLVVVTLLYLQIWSARLGVIVLALVAVAATLARIWAGRRRTTS